MGAGRSISGRPGGCRDTGSTRLRVAPVGYKGPRQGTGPLSYQLLRPVGCPARDASPRRALGLWAAGGQAPAPDPPPERGDPGRWSKPPTIGRFRQMFGPK